MNAITREDSHAFLSIAEQHFRTLNPAFEPEDDWKPHYLEKILANSRMFARWIMVEGQRAGFIIFGLEDHRFLPRLTGMIYELFVLPQFRNMGIARSSAVRAMEELDRHCPAKVQLEVMEGNMGAEALWRSLGFEKVSSRYVRKKTSA